MITCGQWVQLIEAAWRERPIVWLSGVRRVGKTCFDQSLPDVTYFDCELPRVRQTMTDPQGFWESLSDGRVVLDEAHRLPNPSNTRRCQVRQVVSASTPPCLAGPTSMRPATFHCVILRGPHLQGRVRPRRWRRLGRHAAEASRHAVSRPAAPLPCHLSFLATIRHRGSRRVGRAARPGGGAGGDSGAAAAGGGAERPGPPPGARAAPWLGSP